MICYLSTDKYIDLSNPVVHTRGSSVYPFGFIVYNHTPKRTCKEPDRCEYLLTQLIDPKPLQEFLSNCHSTHPELFL